MENRAGVPAGASCSIDTPRGGTKPKVPPVPKLDPHQVQHLTAWAKEHLQAPKKR
jgi:hypothetical protein